MKGLLKLISVLCLLAALQADLFAAYTDAQLIAIRDAFDGRRDSMLSKQVTSPWPDPSSSDTGTAVWGKEGYALGSLYQRNASPTQIASGNQAIIDACARIKSDSSYYTGLDTESFHWSSNELFRLYEFFGPNGKDPNLRGRMTTAAQNAICDVFWNYTKWNSKVADAERKVSKTWYLWGSENHCAMRFSTNYSAAAILKNVAPYNTYKYDDGFTAQQHYNAWNSYFKEYFRERAKKGLLVEIGSHTYSKYTLQGWYNFYDFAEDPGLADLAGMTLDLWWADWAHDQINGVRGGGKARIYQTDGTDLYAADDDCYSLCWFYFGFGNANSQAPAGMCLATSAYRLPLVVMDLALDLSGRGTYEYKSRRQGLNLLPKPLGLPSDMYALDPNYGGIYRYTYVTPQFVIGSLMMEKRAESDWSGISDQNRWEGVIFKTHADARIIPQDVALADSSYKTYNQYWSVQNKGTLITQKLNTSTHTGDMRVYFSRSRFAAVDEDSGWIFVSTVDSYAGVRPAWGSYSWDDTNWAHLSDSTAPVIIEVAPSSGYASYTAFKTAVKALPLSVSNNVLTYTGLNGTFTFYTSAGTMDATKLPKINGTAINLKPAFTFDSPFIHENWSSDNGPSGVVTITKGSRNLTHDFNIYAEQICGDLPFSSADFNKDCLVNFQDIPSLASYWLLANVYTDSGSNNYPNLIESKWADTGIYKIPRATVVPTIDGTISPGEWIDARPIEMIYPTLTTLPNRGTMRSGTTAPSSNADFSLFWYAKWDSDYLYIAGVVYDDDINTGAGFDEPQVIFNYNNDCNHVWLTSAFCINFSNNGVLNSNTGGPSLSHSSMARQNLSGKYVIESKFKWSDIDLGFGYVPAVGDKHGFGFFCQDHNLSGTRVHAFCDYNCNTGLSNPYNFNKIQLANTIDCTEMQHIGGDINNDCKVDLKDFATLAADWLTCTDPSGFACMMGM